MYSSLNKKQSQLVSQEIIHLSVPATERWVGLPMLWGGQETKQIGPIEMPLDQVGQKPYSLLEGLKWANLSHADIDKIFDQLGKVLPETNCTGSCHIL